MAVDHETTSRRNPTLRDVAELAGVSIATASKALNGRENVHPQTRARVVDAAAQISFTPNTLAQAILSGHTGTVGLLTHDLEGRFSLPILMGAEDAFGAGQMSVLLCDAREDAIREQHHIKALLGRRVDGLIVVGSNTNERPSLGKQLAVPTVYVYAPSSDPEDLSIVPDNVGAGAAAIDHLVAAGRTKIAFVSGDVTYTAALERSRGATEALEAHGLSLVGPVRYGSWSESWGRAATTTLIDRGENVDAILCGSDQIARGALDALRDHGTSVPHEVAIMGFDNWEPMVLGARPQLTSVDMNFEAMGRRAAQALFDAISGTPSSGIETMACRVIVRGSTVQEG